MCDSLSLSLSLQTNPLAIVANLAPGSGEWCAWVWVTVGLVCCGAHGFQWFVQGWLVVLGSGFAMGHSSSGPSDDSLTDLGLGWVNLFWVTI